MEPVQFHTRHAVGLGQPTNTSGSPRPLMLMNRPYHTVHYPGIWPNQVFFSGGDGIFDTIDQAFAYLRRVEEIARASGKPYEYNTIIPIMSDNSAHVIAYADEYVAAHSAGENTTAHGTQFTSGINQDINDGAVLAFQWWNAVLEATGRLAANSLITPHKDMPGAQTVCPGVHILARMPQLRTPYVAPVSPKPLPLPEEEDDMLVRYKDSRYSNEFLMPHGTHLSGKLSQAYKDAPLVVDTHDQTLKSLLARNGLTTADLVRQP